MRTDRQRLTKSVVDALKPQAREYVRWCGELPGFGCRVRPTGVKTLIAQYRIGGRNSPSRKVTIGRYGKLTVEQARSVAAIVLAKAELGNDVAYERARARAEITVAQLCDEYLVEGIALKKASTISTDRSRIDRHIRPLLGKKRIGELTRAVIEKFMRDVADGKTARDEKTGKHGRSIVRGGKGAATRTARLLGGILSYAVDRGYIASNPRFGVKLFKDRSNERFLKEVELQQLGGVLRMAETQGLPWTLAVCKTAERTKHRPKMAGGKHEIISPYVVAAIRLLLLTGCRLREILHLRWNDVDVERGLLTLSDSKTGKRVLLLPTSAIEILISLPPIGPYVIAGGRTDKPRTDIKRPWDRIRKAAGLNGLRLHDLRHSFASVAAESGLGLTTVGKLLGHASPSTTARYSHFADDPLRRASEHVSSKIAAALNSNQPMTKLIVRR